MTKNSQPVLLWNGYQLVAANNHTSFIGKELEFTNAEVTDEGMGVSATYYILVIIGNDLYRLLLAK